MAWVERQIDGRCLLYTHLFIFYFLQLLGFFKTHNGHNNNIHLCIPYITTCTNIYYIILYYLFIIYFPQNHSLLYRIISMQFKKPKLIFCFVFLLKCNTILILYIYAFFGTVLENNKKK